MEILNYVVSENPPTIATFSVHIPALKLHLHKLRVMRSKKGHIFISYPSWMEDQHGTKKYFPYLEFEIEKKKEFEAKVFELLKYHYKID